MTQKGATLIAKVETRAQRIVKIKAALGQKSLPSVSVRIRERHFGRPVIDPAAQTELENILQQCGFKLVDEASTNQTQIRITGNAFSAYGLRKGNLVACKARIELEARKRNGDVIAVDRQTSAAVDIAEQTAAKTALEKAADAVAERFIPKLVHQ